MSRTVIKYGGSNLRETDGIRKLLNIIPEYHNPILVVSALFGITNYIEEFLNDSSFSKTNIRKFSDHLYLKHAGFTKELIAANAKQTAINKKINTRLTELEHILLGVHYLRDLPLNLKELILSYGERLSSLLISEILKAEGFNCTEALPENIGLITAGKPGNAAVNISASTQEVKKSLSEPTLFVIPGFYGISKKGKVRLLGRGGTDYSAACIANCIDASSLDIWKDVEGFKSCDPSIISSALVLDSLTYDEAAELAYFGAKILHPRTVEPLINKNIPIRLFSTRVKTIKPLTIINGKKQITAGVIKSITSTDDYCILKLTGSGIGIKSGVLAKVATALNDKKINISSVITSQIAINLIIEKKNIKEATHQIQQLKLPVVQDINVTKDITLLALIGHGMVEQYGIAARAFSVLANSNINVHLSSMGATEVTTYLIINLEDKQKAIEEIHKEFFNN